MQTILVDLFNTFKLKKRDHRPPGKKATFDKIYEDFVNVACYISEKLFHF
jgi:hypothetical protein